MSHIYLPATTADQWAQCLAAPTKHWRTGFSARTLAYAWQEAEGFPREVATALATAADFQGIEVLLAFPEHRVSLPGAGHSSQTDLWVLARAGANLVSIAVEGKVAEPFGATLGDWLAGASPGKQARLAALQRILGLGAPLPPGLRYQLLHRCASTVIEAKRFGAPHAVLLIHSFSREQRWFADFAAFAALFGASPTVGQVAAAGVCDGVQLHLCWVHGDARYLAK